MKRCFVGMRVDGAAREKLADVAARLARVSRSSARRVKVVPESNWHATIKFLGATGDAQVPELVSLLGDVAATFEPPAATLAGLGAFPSPARPRIVFAAIGDGRDVLTRLALAVEEVVLPLGFAREDREHTPHVTLARVDQPRAQGPLSELIDGAAGEGLGGIVTSHLVLFESTPGKEASVYTPLAEVRLGAR